MQSQTEDKCPTFEDSLAALLIQHRDEVQTNTPPEVLARHMIASLRLFEQSLIERSDHPFFRPGRMRG